MSSMLAILFSIDIVWVPLIVVLSVAAGFSFRSRQIRKLRKQVSALEKEMLNSHAEILHMQEEMVRLQNKNTAQKSLVVSMKEVSPADDKKDHHDDVTARKKIK